MAVGAVAVHHRKREGVERVKAGVDTRSGRVVEMSLEGVGLSVVVRWEGMLKESELLIVWGLVWRGRVVIDGIV
jgi:hypothetical protein